MADIVIINPRFDISFWGMEHSALHAAARIRTASASMLFRRLSREELRDGFIDAAEKTTRPMLISRGSTAS